MYIGTALGHDLASAIHRERVATALNRHSHTTSIEQQSRSRARLRAGRQLFRGGSRLAIAGVLLTVIVLGMLPLVASANVAPWTNVAATLSNSDDVPTQPGLVPISLPITAIGTQNSTSMSFLSSMQPVPTDTDGDGLSDDQEAGLGTDPTEYDTDGDGVADGGEINAGTDPLAPDTDGDGFSDKDELDVSSDPLDPASMPTDPEPNSIAVTAYTCPAGYEGKELFTDCVTPAAAVDVTVALSASELGVTQATDAAGQVAFADLGSGSFTVHVDLTDLDGELQRSAAFCAGTPAPGAPEPRQIVFTDLGGGSYGIELTQAEEITCTWFNIPAPASNAPAREASVTALPTTGSGDTSDNSSRDASLFSFAGITFILLVTSVLLLLKRWDSARR